MNFKPQDAQQLLENPLLKTWFEESRENLVKKLESPTIKEEEMQEAVRMLKLLKSLHGHLQGYINTGKIEEFNLRQKKRWSIM